MPKKRAVRGGGRRPAPIGPRCAPADPFFDQPYEAPASEAPPEWEKSAKPAPRVSGNIKPKRKVAALFKSS